MIPGGVLDVIAVCVAATEPSHRATPDDGFYVVADGGANVQAGRPLFAEFGVSRRVFDQGGCNRHRIAFLLTMAYPDSPSGESARRAANDAAALADALGFLPDYDPTGKISQVAVEPGAVTVLDSETTVSFGLTVTYEYGV